ncbi:hypothetical protein BH18ACI5_BH18ACI5_02400 [soil metagenome]
MASDVSSYLEDAAHFPGGHTAGVLSPRTTDEVAEAAQMRVVKRAVDPDWKLAPGVIFARE